MHRPIQIGLLGCGTVGTGVVSILQQNGHRIDGRAGGELTVRRIAVRDTTKPRDIAVSPDVWTPDAASVIEDPDIDIVVELMGGVEPAYRLISQALKRGKSVVTANKEVLARHGAELLAVAAEHGTDLLFEGSVAGGIPIIKPLRECLAANRIRSIMGIINGTTNYMLTGMSRDEMDFEATLQQAQALGYAEADPTSDVEGYDAAFKIAILASIAFETTVRVEDVYCEGITRITPDDIRYGKDLGYAVKLLAIAKEDEGRLELRVHPTFIPESHPLAAVNDVFNAIFVEGDAVGELMFYGRGAGGLPTGSAVVSDIIEAARRRRRGGNGLPSVEPAAVPVKAIEDIVSRFYIRLRIVDEPGVLAAISGVFGRHGVSISSVIQKGRFEDPIDLVFVTHEVREANVRQALADIDELPVVRHISNVIRVEEPES